MKDYIILRKEDELRKDEIVKAISEKTDISGEKAIVVLDQMFVNRAIPSVLRDKIMSNIAKGSEVTVGQAQKAIGAVFGKLTDDPAIFELASRQLVSAWINDCDGCNACGSVLASRQAQLHNIDKPM
jgi:nucleoid DNA-binding protein